MAETA